jgi:hypothetical protein
MRTFVIELLPFISIMIVFSLDYLLHIFKHKNDIYKCQLYNVYSKIIGNYVKDRADLVAIKPICSESGL